LRRPSFRFVPCTTPIEHVPISGRDYTPASAMQSYGSHGTKAAKCRWYRDLGAWQRISCRYLNTGRKLLKFRLLGWNAAAKTGQAAVSTVCLQNLIASVKLNSLTFIAGTTMSNDSSPLAGVPLLGGDLPDFRGQPSRNEWPLFGGNDAHSLPFRNAARRLVGNRLRGS